MVSRGFELESWSPEPLRSTESGRVTTSRWLPSVQSPSLSARGSCRVPAQLWGTQPRSSKGEPARRARPQQRGVFDFATPWLKAGGPTASVDLSVGSIHVLRVFCYSVVCVAH